MKSHFLVVTLLTTLSVSSVLSAATSPSRNQQSPTPKTQTRIDLNHANSEALSHTIKGIGPKKAEAIVAYRDEHHGFKSLDELREVKGIGDKFMEKNKTEIEQTFTLSNEQDTQK
jgi:competence protein ComEA